MAPTSTTTLPSSASPTAAASTSGSEINKLAIGEEQETLNMDAVSVVSSLLCSIISDICSNDRSECCVSTSEFVSENSTNVNDTVLFDSTVMSDGSAAPSVASNVKTGSQVSARKKLHGLLAPMDLNTKIEDGPTQPKLGKYPQTRFASQNRSFSALYYLKFNFLEYSVERDACFCFCCRMFNTSSSEPAFTHSGFNNWKDIGECVRNRAASVCHAEAMSRWQAARSVELGKSEDISCQLDKQQKADISKNRAAVGSLARIAITCARQDIALRGHNEHPNVADIDNVNIGNFVELLELVRLVFCYKSTP